MANSEPKISVKYTMDAVVATIKCERILDESDIKSLDDSIMPLVEERDSIKLVLDFNSVQFLSSAMLGLLIRINKFVAEKNGQLKLCCINDKIMGIFKITRLDKVFHICDDVENAIGSFE